MFCEWNGNTTKIYSDNRSMHRAFHTRLPVRCASVTGEGNDARVSITLTNGRTELYRGDGVLIRR